MNAAELTLPERASKPRSRGLTLLIDNGVPLHHFQDVVESFDGFIDFVKFGWGTSVITKHLTDKIRCLEEHDIGWFFGGTLFEKYVYQGKLAEYRRYLRQHGGRYVEISNGTIDLSNAEKAQYIREFSSEFTVFSEVGFKDGEKSIHLSPARWIEYIQEDLAAGAFKVITEARESGTSGICRSNGEVRYGLIEEIADSGIDLDKVVFEAPNKTLQTYFIRLFGTNVNLGNVAFDDAVALETLRLGLRSDTLLQFS
ncbi:phosphosulfolactate synthase [Alicyclobacillus shizuokensis]|uniref:phosphosulfolactate synthase n=1 Tax=Alicyclobacillus shizuokensis TaxID=392014 RepID=UPI00082E1CE8|nr:phosphosulfolactate synthase [Alicyclobacillus shizuokensis]